MAKLNQKGLLFVPLSWQRAGFLRWLKRIHGWTGFWGAMMFLLLGVSGVLLSHRSVAKIDTGDPIEVSAIDIEIDAKRFDSPENLGQWARDEFRLEREPRAEILEGEDIPKAFLGKQYHQAEIWEVRFNHPNGRIAIEYVKGASHASLKRLNQNIWGLIKNLHKGSNADLPWILFLDMMAGALIAMTLSGILLWTKLHGSRLVAVGIILASIILAVAAITPSWL